MWLKDGEQITITDGYEITVDGCRHILTIPDSTLDDEAEYTIMIGAQESTGLVLVEGKNMTLKFWFLPLIKFLL